jgi:hypothetical protein
MVSPQGNSFGELCAGKGESGRLAELFGVLQGGNCQSQEAN